MKAFEVPTGNINKAQRKVVEIIESFDCMITDKKSDLFFAAIGLWNKGYLETSYDNSYGSIWVFTDKSKKLMEWLSKNNVELQNV